MFTPPGVGGHQPVRRGAGRSRRDRLLATALVTVTVILLGAAVVWERSRDADTVATPTPEVSCPATPTADPAPPVVAPDKVKVNVYNATERGGLAARVAAELRRRGFRVGAVDNDPLGREVTGAAEVRSGPAGVAAARTVAAQVGAVGGVGVSSPDERRNRSVDLVLGEAFSRLQPVEAAAAVLSPSPRPVPKGC